jgi:hypothetical protein
MTNDELTTTIRSGSAAKRLLLEAERHLWELEKFVTPETMLTLVVRLPGNEEAESVITRDDLGEVIKVLERRLAAAEKAGS